MTNEEILQRLASEHGWDPDWRLGTGSKGSQTVYVPRNEGGVLIDNWDSYAVPEFSAPVQEPISPQNNPMDTGSISSHFTDSGRYDPTFGLLQGYLGLDDPFGDYYRTTNTGRMFDAADAKSGSRLKEGEYMYGDVNRDGVYNLSDVLSGLKGRLGITQEGVDYEGWKQDVGRSFYDQGDGLSWDLRGEGYDGSADFQTIGSEFFGYEPVVAQNPHQALTDWLNQSQYAPPGDHYFDWDPVTGGIHEYYSNGQQVSSTYNDPVRLARLMPQEPTPAPEPIAPVYEMPEWGQTFLDWDTQRLIDAGFEKNSLQWNPETGTFNVNPSGNVTASYTPEEVLSNAQLMWGYDPITGADKTTYSEAQDLFADKDLAQWAAHLVTEEGRLDPYSAEGHYTAIKKHPFGGAPISASFDDLGLGYVGTKHTDPTGTGPTDLAQRGWYGLTEDGGIDYGNYIGARDSLFDYVRTPLSDTLPADTMSFARTDANAGLIDPSDLSGVGSFIDGVWQEYEDPTQFTQQDIDTAVAQSNAGLINPNDLSGVGSFIDGAWQEYEDPTKYSWEDVLEATEAERAAVTSKYGSFVDPTTLSGVGQFVDGAWTEYEDPTKFAQADIDAAVAQSLSGMVPEGTVPEGYYTMEEGNSLYNIRNAPEWLIPPDNKLVTQAPQEYINPYTGESWTGNTGGYRINHDFYDFSDIGLVQDEETNEWRTPQTAPLMEPQPIPEPVIPTPSPVPEPPADWSISTIGSQQIALPQHIYGYTPISRFATPAQAALGTQAEYQTPSGYLGTSIFGQPQYIGIAGLMQGEPFKTQSPIKKRLTKAF